MKIQKTKVKLDQTSGWLASRLTYCEWDKQLMGPIHDLLGAEQGGINSVRLYKLVNNNQIKVAQLTQMGINMSNQMTQRQHCSPTTSISSKTSCCSIC